MANKKAWVTASLFEDWFNNCFIPEVRKYMKQKGLEFKILLLIDNAPSHPVLDHPIAVSAAKYYLTDSATGSRHYSNI